MTCPKIILGVTGSVAAKLTPSLAKALQAIGQVQVVATGPSLYFWERGYVGTRTWTDEDEWTGDGYVKNQTIPHIALGDWADILVIAPLTANTLTKMALGLSDNLLTCLYCAWPSNKPVIIAPAMNTRMWENPLTESHMAAVRARPNHRVVLPVKKHLACGTTGIGAMADITDIAEAVRKSLP